MKKPQTGEPPRPLKIAIVGSAPSSIRKAPCGDPTWKIWACSPGTYHILARVDEFWEVHRWEPPVIGKADQQKPWFSPEYCQWLGTVPPVVWVADPEAQKALGSRAKMLPWRELVALYGHYVFTSSISYMLAMAINKILTERARRGVAEDTIGLWGVDMAANEELYSGQRSAAQFFIQVIVGLGIKFSVPDESDLCVPPPLYGVNEINHRTIKLTERRRELDGRLAAVQVQLQQAQAQALFLQGAIDDIDYHQKMWLHEGDSLGFSFGKLFPLTGAALPVKPGALPMAPIRKPGERSKKSKIKPPDSKLGSTAEFAGTGTAQVDFKTTEKS